MNKTGKTLLGIGCGCLGIVVLGAIAIGIGVYWFARGVSVDPTVVTASAAEIASFDLPEDFVPDLSMPISIPMAGTMHIVSFHENGGQGELIIAELSGSMAKESLEDMLAAVRNVVETHKGKKSSGKQILSTKTVNGTVRGKPASFIYSKLKDANSNAESWQLIGTFAPKVGKEGIDLAELVLPTTDWEEADLEDFAKSIK